MTTPKPPEGYDNWLDWLLNEHRNGYATPVMIANRELAELRAYKAAYDKAMKILRNTTDKGLSRTGLIAFYNREIAAGRFKP